MLEFPSRERLFVAEARSVIRVLLIWLLICSSISARPLFGDERRVPGAVHKGQTKLIVVSEDFPQQFLSWQYLKPQFIRWHLDYKRWESDYLSYFKKTYGQKSLTFKPTMIVMHYTVVPTAEQTFAVLQRRQVSVHLMIDTDGTIYELMPLNRRCNGAYGVNHKALSIEMVARTEGDLLSRPYQIFQSFCAVRYLMAKYNIPLNKIVGHYEVGMGVSKVPDYLDLADPYYPTRYPPSSKRTDPGETYMRWLRTYLKVDPPSPFDL